MSKKFHITFNMLTDSIDILEEQHLLENCSITNIIEDKIKTTYKCITKEYKIYELHKSICSLCNYIVEVYSDNEIIIDKLSGIETQLVINKIDNKSFIHMQKMKRAYRLTKSYTKKLNTIHNYFGLKTKGDTLSYIICSHESYFFQNKHILIKDVVLLQNVVTYIKEKYTSKETEELEREVQDIWEKIYAL